MSGPEPRRPSPAEGVLAQLLHDTLDDGYAMVAKERADGASAGTPERPRSARGRRNRDATLTAFACVLIGLILVVAYVHTNRAAPTDARTRADLITRIKQEQKDSAELQRQAQSLAAQVDAQRTGALGGVAAGSVLASAQAQAGTTAVRGPGVRVMLGNPDTPSAGASTGRAGSTPISALSVLTDVDVRAVVNELWHDGAEAIAVNKVRLTPISAIRFAGEAVLVDFQPITSPYSFEAIGNSDTMITSFTDSATASKYHTLASADGFQFSAAQVKTLELAASVLSEPRYAHLPPARTPTSTPTSTSEPSRTPTAGTPS